MSDASFKILLGADSFKCGDLLTTANGNDVEVVDTPKKHYNKWYYKLLNFITFRKYFNVSYTYTVKLK